MSSRTAAVGKTPRPVFPLACFLSALFGTIGASAGKVCFSLGSISATSPYFGHAIRLALFVTLFLSNSLSLKYYVQSLLEFTSFQATTISFAFNFICSGVGGYLLFGEALTLRWSIGCSLMLAGVAVMLLEGAEEGVSEKQKEEIGKSA